MEKVRKPLKVYWNEDVTVKRYVLFNWALNGAICGIAFVFVVWLGALLF